MKKLILLLLMCFLFVGCKTTEGTKDVKYDIHFDTQGMVTAPEVIEDVTKIPFYLPKVDCDGYDFMGWYYDVECSKKVKLGEVIESDVTLYAKWSVISTGSFDTPVIPGK